MTLRQPLCQSHAELGTHPGKTLGIPSPGKAWKPARCRQAEEGEAAGAEGAGAWRPGRRAGTGGGVGEAAGRLAERRPASPAPAEAAGRPPRQEHSQFPGSSPEKVPAGQGKKALARLTWGRPTCCKAWDPGCQRILTAAGSETRGPRHLGVLHASPAAPRKGGRGGARGADKLGGAWLADAGSTGPVWPSPGRHTQQLRGRRRAVRVGGRAGCAVWPRVARRRSRLSQTWREGAL